MPTQFTPEFQRRTMLKVSWRLLPLIVVCYLMAYIDRTNVSFAALTMNKDLGLTAYWFGLGAGIFFLGYALFEVPSNMVLQRAGARVWIARIMITWGIISGLMAAATGPISFLVLRFLLGVAEAGFFPGIIFYLTYWFPVRVSRPRHLDPVHRRAGLERDRVDALRRHSRDGRHARTQRLAMGLHPRGDPGGPARLRRAVADDRSPGPRDLARSRRARVARSRAGGRAQPSRERRPPQHAAGAHRPARAGPVGDLLHGRHRQLRRGLLSAADHQGPRPHQPDDGLRDGDSVHASASSACWCGAIPRTGATSAAGTSSSRPRSPVSGSSARPRSTIRSGRLPPCALPRSASTGRGRPSGRCRRCSSPVRRRRSAWR